MTTVDFLIELTCCNGDITEYIHGPWQSRLTNNVRDSVFSFRFDFVMAQYKDF